MIFVRVDPATQDEGLLYNLIVRCSRFRLERGPLRVVARAKGLGAPCL
jgi:hypothetical protein